MINNRVLQKQLYYIFWNLQVFPTQKPLTCDSNTSKSSSALATFISLQEKNSTTSPLGVLLLNVWINFTLNRTQNKGI